MRDISAPQFDEMMNPLLQALKNLGGSGSVSEIENDVFSIMGLPQEVLDLPKNEGEPGPSKVAYRLAWTRNYLKNYGLLENSSYGVWSLTPEGWKAEDLDEKSVVREVKRRQRQIGPETAEIADEGESEQDTRWQDALLGLISNLEPAAFERLAQRLLRESGFVKVEVTGRSGDGGIGGKGILRLGGLMSFHVMFQCKRHQSPIGAKDVRDFRGALQGRADRGLLITSSTFTRDAIAEANRDGATPIELIDGEELVTLLKEKRLGVQIETSEVVQVKEEWFNTI